MKKVFIVANWKSYKTETEAKEWLEEFVNSKLNTSDKAIIICPSYTLIPSVQEFVNHYKLPFAIGAQDISSFPQGPHTGEVNARQVQERCTYVIIGHSERRNNLGETDDLLRQKNQLAKEVGLTSIYCIQSKDTVIPDGVNIVAYEPVSAIGTGNPDTPENAEEIAVYLKTQKNIQTVLYGGSVDPDNVNAFTHMPHIDGVLVGGASLDPVSFSAIIQNA